MNSRSKIGEKQSVTKCHTSKRLVDSNDLMQREVHAFYRNSECSITSDSVDSSLKDNDFSNESNCQNSYLPYSTIHNPQVHDEIIDQLSKLKIGGEGNCKDNIDAEHQTSLKDNRESHSILTRNTPMDSIYHKSVHSLVDSRYSSILAGRFDSKDNIEATESELSLLNIAINESVESNGNIAAMNLASNKEDNNFVCSVKSCPYIDSLEVEREETSLVDGNEIDSLEGETYNIKSNLAHNASSNIDEYRNSNIFVNIHERRNCGRLKIISNETVSFEIDAVKTPDNECLPVFNNKENMLKDTNDNIKPNSIDSDLSNEMKYMSSITESERLITKAVKTPNTKAIQFIEDCCKSTPVVGLNADTFSSDIVTDISNSLTVLDANAEHSETDNRDTNFHRKQIFKKFSQQFAEEPIKFTEQLITLIEESVLHSKPENFHASDVSLNRLTEEFRKMCKEHDKWIEDESMPDFTFGSSFTVSNLPTDQTFSKAQNKDKWQRHTSESTNCLYNETTVSPMHNFTRLGGGKKVYRKTPKRIFKTCDSPKCTNILHRVDKNTSNIANYYDTNDNFDSTATFELWENLCYEMSPNKHVKFEPFSHANCSGAPTHEDLIRRSNEQMASLDESISTNEGIVELNHDKNYIEMEELLTARLVEKRRKCFEEARKAFEVKQSAAVSKNAKSFDNVSTSTSKTEVLDESIYEAKFLDTLSACVDYFDNVKTLENHRNSLQCILECSEESKSELESTVDSKSLKFVETMILPVKNCAKHKIQNPELLATSDSNSNFHKSKLISETYFYLPDTTETSIPKSPKKSPKKSPQVTPVGRHSPGTQACTIVSKKIKSSVSRNKMRKVQAIKPASHTRVPKSPAVVLEEKISDNKQRSSHNQSRPKLNPQVMSKAKSAEDSPSLMDVTNIKKNFQVPKVVITNPTPVPCKKSNYLKILDENTEVNSQKQFPEVAKTREHKKYFYSPGRTPTYGKVKPRKMFFQTPKRTPLQNKLPATSPSTPGSYRLNYNTVLSPVGMYIRGTNPNLITNVKGKTNEKMLTPRPKTPNSKSKPMSPILARSPHLSPTQTEYSRLKFQLTPRQKQKETQECNILNDALCESDPSSNIGTENISNSPFPKIFYKPASCVQMVKDSQPQRGCAKTLAKGTEEKIIYHHAGRLNSAKRAKEPDVSLDYSTENSLPHNSRDISLLHQRPAMKTNYLVKK